MPIETIEFKGDIYPSFQTDGNAARFCRPFALEVCKGVGVDVGANRLEWRFPGSLPIDPAINQWDAYNFPETFHHNPNFPESSELDYVHASHSIEHLPHWATAVNYWHSRLKNGGICFIYAPDHSQRYWRTHHNFKHIHCFTPEILKAYFTDQPQMWHQERLFVSGVDAYNSFIVIAEKL